MFFAKAQKQRIAALFNDFCNNGKGQKNKFKCKIYFVSNPKSVNLKPHGSDVVIHPEDTYIKQKSKHKLNLSNLG